MIEQVRAYLMALVAAALLAGLLQSLPVKGGVKRMLSLGCGLFLCIVLLRPLLELRFGDLSEYLDAFALPEDQMQDVQEENQLLAGEIIKEQTETYILDKANELGVEVTVEVGLQALSDTYRYPYQVTITGILTPAQQEELSEYITEIFGIPGERQIWNPTKP